MVNGFLPLGGSRTRCKNDIDTLWPYNVGDNVLVNNCLFIQQTQSNMNIHVGPRHLMNVSPIFTLLFNSGLLALEKYLAFKLLNAPLCSAASC